MRKYLLIPAVIAGLLSSHAIAAFSNPEPAVAKPCADLVIGVDGTGSVGDPNSIVKMRAGRGAWIIRYPGSIFPIGPYTYDTSVRMGIDETKRVIREYRALNPCATVHLIGHSQGSRVAGDAIAELYAEGMDTSFITAELLSDPRDPNGGVELAFTWLKVQGYTMNGPRGSLGGADVTYRCVPGDPICDWPRSVLGLAGVVPNFVKLHGRY
ncbi:PE-PPE domain-containing protein [Rhodococcus sp. NPDC019627]|uniref:PE-PPE domain-containing protein n=1 Tax=unclassified Rhodococcus (in: high G+C Gram-positive bacteria) TaxID=192944 RepID=UPI0033EEFD95